MIKQCPFKNGRCEIWFDHMIMEDELILCDELLHSNWIEITSLYDRIDVLEKYIVSIGCEIPTEKVKMIELFSGRLPPSRE